MIDKCRNVTIAKKQMADRPSTLSLIDISSLRNSMVCASHFLTVTAIFPMPRLHIRAFLLITIPYLGRITVVISMF